MMMMMKEERFLTLELCDLLNSDLRRPPGFLRLCAALLLLLFLRTAAGRAASLDTE